MKFFLGNLLFVLCLINTSKALATVSSQSNDNEIISNTYVQIDRQVRPQATVSQTISVIQTAKTLTAIISQKAYSLLRWSSYSRTGSLEIPNYDRKLQFGRWVNDPNDDTCYNTRAKVLIRDSFSKVVMRETNNCVVDQGKWFDPYTDDIYTSAKEIQVDHLVPLKNAYMSGAHKWNYQVRCLYANYLGLKEHLLSVEASENMRKSDKSPDEYMPPNSEYTCTYLKNWLTVKFLWGLELTLNEARAIRQKMTEAQCNPKSFVITDADFKKQLDYVKANRELCSLPTSPQPSSSD